MVGMQLSHRIDTRLSHVVELRKRINLLLFEHLYEPDKDFRRTLCIVNCPMVVFKGYL